MTKKRLSLALVAAFSLVAACGSGRKLGSGDAPDTLRVAYFREWPTPSQFGQADGSFAEAVGVDIEWVPFNSGGEMGEAMEADQIDISYSQGITPFANFINDGADLKLVGIAISYAEADNCVVQGALGVNQRNAAQTLKGAVVMTPFGNVTHFKMLSMMEHLGVNLDDLEIVEAIDGATTAKAFEAGTIDAGCTFGGSVENMLGGGGELIMTGAEHESEIGIFSYDVVSIPTSFGEEYPKVVSSFLKALDDFNAAWAADPDGRNPTIAKAAGMVDTGNFLAGPVWFDFPTIDEQLGSDWLGGNVAATMQSQLETFARLGQIESVNADFAGAIDTRYLENAK